MAIDPRRETRLPTAILTNRAHRDLARAIASVRVAVAVVDEGPSAYPAE